jgi:predicted porin
MIGDAMKKLILAALLGSCFATPVLAQSSVEIYGVADAGVMWQHGGPTSIISGGEEGSRLGFKGSEDMGRGYKAIFTLEARVELDTGTQQPRLINDNQGLYLTRGMGALPPPVLQAVRTATQPEIAVNPENALFDRTCMVGLVTPYGAVLLGRMYTPEYEVFAAADAFEVGTAGTWGTIISGTGGFTALGVDIRSQRAIQYRLKLPSGVGGSFMAAARNSGYYGFYNKFFAAALTYKANGWDIGIGHNHAYDQQDHPSLKSTTVGGSYTWGDWKFFAGWHNMRNQSSALMDPYINGWDTMIAPQLAPLGPVTANALRNIFISNIQYNSQVNASSVQVGLQYRMGPGRLTAAVSHTNDRMVTDSDATLYAIGYSYFVSRRTDIYTVASFISNQNFAQFSPGTAGSPGGFTTAPGDNGRAFQVGMRYKF